MKEEHTKDIFDYKHIDALVFPAHGYVLYTGELMILEGPSKKAKDKWGSYPSKLGHMIQMHGSHCFMLSKTKKKEIRFGVSKLKYHLVHFPIQPNGGISTELNVQSEYKTQYKKGFPVPGWAMRVDLDLVKQSCKEMSELAKVRHWKKVVIAQPAVSENTWKKMRKVMRKYLDKRFTVVMENLK